MDSCVSKTEECERITERRQCDLKRSLNTYMGFRRQPFFGRFVAFAEELQGHLIGKKVEVSLRFFDIFEKNMVFVFLCEN